jgi:hypothetical protein
MNIVVRACGAAAVWAVMASCMGSRPDVGGSGGRAHDGAVPDHGDAAIADAGAEGGSNSGNGGLAGVGGFSGGGGAGAELSPAPWAESCVPAANRSRPAGAFLLTGPAGTLGLGDAAVPGEHMSARLNGLERTFDRFGAADRGFTGYGFDGSISLRLPSLAAGTYSCASSAGIVYNNSNAGGRDSNVAGSVYCCTITITRSGAVGEPIEGTFSGILVHDALISWIKVEDGSFSVIRRASAGGNGGVFGADDGGVGGVAGRSSDGTAGAGGRGGG